MANLSNINNKFIVTDVGTGQAIVGATNAVALSTLTVGSTAADTILAIANTVNWKIHSASSSSPYAVSSGDFLIRNASTNVLNLQNNGNAIFSGKIIGQDGGSVQLELRRGTSVGENANTSIKFIQPLGNSFLGLSNTGALSFGTAANLITDNKFKVDKNGNGTFAGTLQSGNFAIGVAPSSFGSGVPTITLQGTAANNRGGAIVFKEQDGTVTTNIYSTDGSDGYGTVINAAQGSFRVSIGALAANKLEIDSSGNTFIKKNLELGEASNTTSSSNNYIPLKINTTYSTTASPQWSLQGWVATTDGADPFTMTSGEVTKNVYMGMIGAAYMNQNRFSIIQGGVERVTVNLTQTGGGGAQGNVGIGTSLPTQKLDVNGLVKHLGLDMTAGIQVDQTTSYTKTLTGTANTWRPTGIDYNDIGNSGSYLVQVFSDDHSGAGPANYSWYWTGTMSWFAGGTNNNVTSEIFLQGCGHHTNMVLELRTKVNFNNAALPYAELEWKSATSFVNSPNWIFKFRRLI